MLTSTKLVFTLIQVFVNTETVNIYLLLFKRVFDLLSEICEASVQFYYLYNSEIQAILMNMYSKQMSDKKLTYF